MTTLAHYDRKPANWSLRATLGGAIAGFLFVVLFVRVPRWLGSPTGTAFGIILMACVYGGGYLGWKLYEQHGHFANRDARL